MKTLGLFYGITFVNPSKYNGWDGACPGCDIDARNMFALSLQFGVESKIRLNEKAKKKRVKKDFLRAVQKMVNPRDLLILYLSGHGGQQPDKNGDELDGMDETMLFYDGEIVDDQVHELLSLIPAGMRIFMVNDCCNSGTNFRGMNVKKGTPVSVEKVIPKNFQAQLIHYAGCADGRYSFGTKEGGLFTNALMETFTRKTTYASWFKKAKKKMPKNQVPVYSEYGPVTDAFRNTLVWR